MCVYTKEGVVLDYSFKDEVEAYEAIKKQQYIEYQEKLKKSLARCKRCGCNVLEGEIDCGDHGYY